VLFAAGASGAIILVVCGALVAVQLFASEKIGLASMGAREVSPQEYPELHAMIERLCVQADIPKPKVAVADTPMPNAFAIGRSRKHATVCATTGIMELLSPAELEGVMAHELSHIANRDVMVMTLASFFASIASMIVQFGFFFGGGGGRDRRRRRPELLRRDPRLDGGLRGLVLLMQALSRYREFAADRGAAVITGRPSALASALLKISGTMERIPQRDLRASERDGGVLHRPAEAQELRRRPLLDAPADGEAHRSAARLERQLQGTDRAALAV
jgi:heat shock protein HtpX